MPKPPRNTDHDHSDEFDVPGKPATATAEAPTQSAHNESPASETAQAPAPVPATVNSEPAEEEFPSRLKPALKLLTELDNPRSSDATGTPLPRLTPRQDQARIARREKLRLHVHHMQQTPALAERPPLQQYPGNLDTMITNVRASLAK